ncbi:MAG: Phosphatidylglycerol/phosphatidylinositol transfer protein [Peltula sp. TS41687]|nr:MAG: Phosphatidylglycerol/phosphatidylinositol transfer protein [Peltula sp. TS41687]
MYDILAPIVQALSWSTTMQRPLSPHSPPHQHSLASSGYMGNNQIPGGSPFRFCHESHEADLFSISQIELDPQPLHIDDSFEVRLYASSNEKLTRELPFSGTFLQDITDGATWTMLSRYGNSSEHESGTLDFCESIDSIDQPDRDRERECPPEKGDALITMSAWVMPMFIVPGDYYFRFDAVTKEGRRIYCLDVNIHLDYDKDKKGRQRSRVDSRRGEDGRSVIMGREE